MCVTYYRYPVILSIENHCSTKQQQAMAYHMKTIFGERLYLQSRDTDRQQLPSPEFFKGKVLIKVPTKSAYVCVRA